MRSNTPLTRSLALGLSAAVITVAAGTAASAAPTSTRLTAALRASSTAPQVGSLVQFDVHGTKVPQHDTLKSITISFGDHTKAAHLKTARGSTKHAFAKPGTYTVTVTIVDKHGKRSVRTKKIVVHARPITTPTIQPTSHTFPIVVPATATPTTLLGSILSVDQLTAVATQMVTPANLIGLLPVGYLGLLPASELSLPPAGLPRLPGLAGLNFGMDLLTQLTSLTGLPINVPTSGVKLTTPLDNVSLISFAQLGTVGALFGEPTSIVGQLPLVSLFLLPTSLLHAGAPSLAGLPLTIPSGLLPTDLISTLITQLNLSQSVVNEIASLLSTPPSVLPQLPVGYLGLLTQLSPTSIINGNLLPGLPGLTGIDLTTNLLTLLASLVTHGLNGFPLSLPSSTNLTQTLGSLPTTALSATQAGSLATIFGITPSLVAQLPVQSLNLLPSGLYAFAPSTSTATLPIAVPPGLSATETIGHLVSTLGLPTSIVDQLAGGLSLPTDVFDQLPVAVLKALPSSLATLPGSMPTLPGLDGLSLVGLIATLTTDGLTGLPVTIPSDFNAASTIGALPAQAESATTISSLAQIFAVPVSVLDQVPVSLLQSSNVVPSSLITTGGTLASYLTGLPLSLTGTLSPTELISSLGLSATALSSVSSLLNIPTGTLQTLPVGFLKLLPGADVTGSALPALPGLASLPLVGNLLAMLLDGLPIAMPAGTLPTTLISALSNPLTLVQLTTLSTFFGISTSTLSSLPVSVLTLLPTGYVTGL